MANNDEVSGAQIDSLEILITAAEAFPRLEQCFLETEKDIIASFRVFELDTKLRSDAALDVGETWFDLIVHTLRRGVHLQMMLADFDPIAATRMHRRAQRSLRDFRKAAEVAGPEAQLTVEALHHPARAGLLPKLAFWPLAARKLKSRAREISNFPSDEQKEFLKDVPGLKPYLKQKANGRIAARIGYPLPLYPVTHHHKLAVFDRKSLYIGGLDTNDRRYDTPDHNQAAKETWQDVQLLVQGPVVAEAVQYLQRFHHITENRAPAYQTGSGQFLTTLSSVRRFSAPYLSPKTVSSSIKKAHVTAAGDSKQLIYLETQFFRDKQFARVLAHAAQKNPGLHLILILPAAPDDVAFENNTGPDARLGEYLQARCLAQLEKGFAKRLFVGAPARPETQKDNSRASFYDAPLIYVHAKVSIFDDHTAIVSSANLNGRSLLWDSEAGVSLVDPRQILHLRKRVFAHWLPADTDKKFFDLETAFTAWRDLAHENASRSPPERRGFILPYDRKKAEQFGHMVPVVPDELV